MATPTHAVAIDTAAFQSADSFVEPPSGLADPAAAASFEMVLDAFCSGAALHVPLPKDVRAKRPRLFSLWQEWVEVPNVRLSAQGVNEIGARLVDSFLNLAKGSAPSLAQWIAFQFTPQIVTQYIGRTGWELDDVREVAQFTLDVIGRPEANNLLNALDELRSKNVLSTPPEYYSFIGTFQSENHLAVSYLVSVYLRGWSYASSLYQHPAEPEYRSLWLRAPALRDPAIVAKREPLVSSDTYFWGRLLRRMFDPRLGALPQDFDAVQKVASSLRAHRDDIFAEAQIYAPDSVFSASLGRGTEAPTNAEIAIVTGILKAGGVLPYNSRGLEDKLLKALRAAASVLGDKAAKTVEYVTADLRRNWVYTNLSKAEAYFRLRFRRSNFWEIYEDLGIVDFTANSLQ
jgi:hypothetical protein